MIVNNNVGKEQDEDKSKEDEETKLNENESNDAKKGKIRVKRKGRKTKIKIKMDVKHNVKSNDGKYSCNSFLRPYTTGDLLYIGGLN